MEELYENRLKLKISWRTRTEKIRQCLQKLNYLDLLIINKQVSLMKTYMSNSVSKKAIKTQDLRNTFATINSHILGTFDIHSDNEFSKQPSIIDQSNGNKVYWIYIDEEYSEKDKRSTASSNSQHRFKKIKRHMPIKKRSK